MFALIIWRIAEPTVDSRMKIRKIEYNSNISSWEIESEKEE